MSRLRNRMVNAEFYTDPELLRWPSAKRDLYRAMWAMAEDSCCIEDDPFGWKCAAFPSPLDSKTHSVAKFTAWRDELIEAGKAVEYGAAGGRCLFLPDMAEHEHPRNPQSPNLPLPPWVTWQQHPSDLRKGTYVFDWVLYKACTTVETTNLTVPVLSCPVLPCPAQSSSKTPSLHGLTERTRVESGVEEVSIYFRAKTGREPNKEEASFVKRAVKEYGPGDVKAWIGYAVEAGADSIPGYAMDGLKKSTTRETA